MNIIFLFFCHNFNFPHPPPINFCCYSTAITTIFCILKQSLEVRRFTTLEAAHDFSMLIIFFSNNLYMNYCQLLSVLLWTPIVFFFHVKVQSHLRTIPFFAISIRTLILLLNLLVLSALHYSFRGLYFSSLI